MNKTKNGSYNRKTQFIQFNINEIFFTRELPTSNM